MKTIRLFAVLAIFALPALADLSAKYKTWPSSPQGMFMTKGERAEWSAIQTDTEAEQFVTKFLASRGPDFPAMVAERVANADKYLTYGKTPGSQTLRGKIIIVLGPPTSFGISERAKRRAAEGTTGGSVASAGSAGAGGMPTLGDMAQAVDRGQMGGNVYRNYDIGYTAEKTPAGFGKPLAVSVELDTTTGAERVTDRKAEASLDAALEMAAAQSINRNK